MNIFVFLFQDTIKWINGLTGDFGITIVLLTIVIRIVLLPLNMIQRRQVERQREINKEAEKIKEKYKKNERRQQEELQSLYSKSRIGSGSCFISIIQIPVMICLYKAIRVSVSAGATTVLLPWISSLLLRDPTLFLPMATLVVQMLPQIYPHLRLFQKLNLEKCSIPMLLVLLFSNSMFVFVIPAGMGLYYFVSGIFLATEQFVYHLLKVYRFNQREAING